MTFTGFGHGPTDKGELDLASERLSGVARVTPMLRSASLDARAGIAVHLKLECLQESGSFKFRGAANKILSLDARECRRGVIACSGSNHGVAVAYAAARLGVPATILMPKDTPSRRVSAVKDLGVVVRLYHREADDPEELCRHLVEKRGFTLIRATEDETVIAGYGTCVREAFAQVPEVGELEAIFVPASSGGLAAGIALAIQASRIPCSTIVVEPVGFDDIGRSLASGGYEQNIRRSGSVCGELINPSPGKLALPILRNAAASGTNVTDADVLRAMKVAFEEFQLLLEPSGAIALAAVLAGRFPEGMRSALVVLTGGNIEYPAFLTCLSRVTSSHRSSLT